MALDRDTVVQVLLRERLRIAAIATAIVRDVHAADDIFQQVVLAALEHADQFHDAHHVVAWAVKAVRHRAVDLTQRRRLLCLPDEVLDCSKRSGATRPRPRGPTASRRCTTAWASWRRRRKTCCG